MLAPPFFLAELLGLTFRVVVLVLRHVWFGLVATHQPPLKFLATLLWSSEKAVDFAGLRRSESLQTRCLCCLLNCASSVLLVCLIRLHLGFDCFGFVNRDSMVCASSPIFVRLILTLSRISNHRKFCPFDGTLFVSLLSSPALGSAVRSECFDLFAGPSLAIGENTGLTHSVRPMSSPSFISMYAVFCHGCAGP